MRIFLAATLVLLGCSHRVTRPQPGSRIERTVALMPDSEPGGLFPEISDPTRASSLLAARDAPLCSLDLNSTTSTWDEVQTPIESRYLKAVALRLPPGFMPAWYSHPRDPDEEDSEELADSGEYLGHMLGSWDRFDATSPGVPADFTIWIGPKEGYPTWGIGGAEVRQVSFTECRVQTAIGLLPVALFAVESTQPRIGGHAVVTYFKIQNGVYIQASGHAPDSATQALLLGSLSTLRVVR